MAKSIIELAKEKTLSNSEKISLAIKKINPNASFGIQGEVIEGLIWSDGTDPIPKADIEAKYSEVEAEWNAKKYYDVRQVSYPNIGDQLDDLYKQGAFSAEMTAKIKKVKDDNPK
tara:strand:- start:27 stop:371 length:345 start_codon:yes stop_codon:yes gene_type:complete